MMDEVWYDPIINKRICRLCGERNELNGAYCTVTAAELAATGGGAPLTKLLKEREKK